MKHILLLTIVITAMLSFQSCKKKKINIEDETINIQDDIDSQSPDDCSRTLNLLAGQNILVGSVTIFNDESNLYVKYNLNSGWELTSTHLFVGGDSLVVSEIPVNNGGNPKVGHFPYKEVHNNIVNYTYTIPLADIPLECMLISAKAEVTNGTQNEGAWAEGIPFPGGNWAMYSTYCTNMCETFYVNLNSNIDYSNISEENGMLVFNNMTTLENTLSELERQTEEWDDAFLNKYSDLPLTGLEQKEEDINYDEFVPYKEFENRYSFQTLRSIIEEETELWLANVELDIETDPDNHFIVENEMRALLNEFSEIKIGQSIFKITFFGWVEVTDGDFDKIIQLRHDITLALGMNNVNIEGDITRDRNACSTHRRNSEFMDSPDGTKQMKWKVGHIAPFTNKKCFAKVTNYKQKSDGGWKTYRDYIYVCVYGEIAGSTFVIGVNGAPDIYVPNCSQAVTFNTVRFKETQNGKPKRRLTHNESVNRKTQSGWVYGFHKNGAGIELTTNLTW